jgi:quinoprotein glucose dehydrogenase
VEPVAKVAAAVAVANSSNSPTVSQRKLGAYAPPHGALVAVDVNTGDIAWTSTLGINENLAELGDVGLKTGTRNLGGSIATAGGLVFIGATNDHRFRAFDAKTARKCGSPELPASGHSTPITIWARTARYVAIAASGGTSGWQRTADLDQLVAFKLGGGQ